MKEFIVKWIVFVTVSVSCSPQMVFDEVLQKNVYAPYSNLAMCYETDTLYNHKVFADSLEALEFYKSINQDERISEICFYSSIPKAFTCPITGEKIIGCFPKYQRDTILIKN